MNIAGVLAIPPSYAFAPTRVMPSVSQEAISAPVSLESLPMAIRSSFIGLPSFAAVHFAKALPILVQLSSVRLTSLPPGTAIAMPLMSLPF